jgi:uncharacterized membrane protein YbhN (UPF0104 family)
MMPPHDGKAHIGALAGAIVGAIGGLFALGLAHSILERNPAFLLATPMLSLVSWVISGLSAWFLGGAVGPLMGKLFKSQKAEAIGGAFAGLVPVVLIALWGWYMVTRH